MDVPPEPALRTAAPAQARRARGRTHAVDASGRVLRDNVWGEQHEDATRRDFTINAMYYDPATQTVLDYHDGMADIRARLLRMIGDPATRYREDPVRMLRVVRFAAKLGFEIDEATRAPIKDLADLMNNVPAARLFDEMLKLLLSGHALACLTRLRQEGLHHGVLPLLDVVLEQPHGEKFVTLALTSTDERVRAGKPVSPGFLFATLLWHDVQTRWQQYTATANIRCPHCIARWTMSSKCRPRNSRSTSATRRTCARSGVFSIGWKSAAAARSSCWNTKDSGRVMISCYCDANRANSSRDRPMVDDFIDADQPSAKHCCRKAARSAAARRSGVVAATRNVARASRVRPMIRPHKETMATRSERGQQARRRRQRVKPVFVTVAKSDPALTAFR